MKNRKAKVKKRPSIFDAAPASNRAKDDKIKQLRVELSIVRGQLRAADAALAREAAKLPPSEPMRVHDVIRHLAQFPADHVVSIKLTTGGIVCEEQEDSPW